MPGRLSWKLLVAIIPPVVLAVSAIVWLQYAQARREILSAIHKEMSFLAGVTAGTIDGLADQRAHDLLTLSETSLIADYYRNRDFQLHDEAESYRKELERFLANFASRVRVYARVLYLDERGREVCGVKEPGAWPQNHARADYFTKARAAGYGNWWVSPVIDLPGVGPVVYYAKPVHDELKVFKGALVLGYDLSQLSSLLRNVKVGRRGRAFIRAADGRVLEGGAAAGSGLELLRASSPMARLNWSVVVEAPLDDFLDPLRTVRDAALLTSLAGIAALVGVLLLMVRSVTRPLAALASAARKVGAGDFSHRFPNPGSDELGTLSGAFNEMGEHLEENRRRNSELQAQLIQAEKLSAVGQLISAVAHELNNPLAAIFGQVQMSMLEACPPGLREDLERIHRNSLRCAKVVDNLLFFVRQSRHERTKVDLNLAADSALDLIGYRLAKTEDVAVVRDLAKTPPAIVGDFQQIVQVIVNLANNACDSMGAGPTPLGGKRLSIRTEAVDGRAFILIEDNGPGLAPAARDKLFQPFFTTKEPGRGTGLGLSICRQIADDHGGTITFDSKPGQGCVFRVELPLGRPADFDRLEEVVEAPLEKAVPGKRVLVADDEKDIAELMARLMREDGDEVDVVYNGAEALKQLEERAYDLLISDIGMEHAKGTDLYERVKSKGLATRMLFVTGDILNPAVLGFLSGTKSEYLVKPFDIRALRQAARRLLNA
ncbi:MAG: response regulator [Elusimicrobia bacterium]|nr:response regulator [Elusimicrobiota bacterium]